jgi:hypothetical protein
MAGPGHATVLVGEKLLSDGGDNGAKKPLIFDF